MPKIRANSTDIYFEDKGAGDPLLLIAGFACDHTIWFKVLSALAAKFRVIVFDNRGVGQTSGFNSVASIRQMAMDAAGLLDVLGVDKAHVAGHSMGGMIAQELALARPERVRSLVLISTSCQVDERGKAIIESWGDLLGQLDPVAATRLILPWIYTSAFFARPGAIEQAVEQILSNPYPPTLQVMHCQSRAIREFDSSNRLGKINCSSLVMVGKEDILIPIAASEQMARGIQGASLAILEGTGHNLLIESPGTVVKVVLEFLSRVSA